MKKLSRILIAGAMMIAPVFGFTQDQDNLWTLEECIEYAQKNNLTIQNNRLNVQRTEVNLTQAKANYYPSFSMGGSYGYNFGRSIDPTTNLFTRNTITSTNFNGSANWTLFAGNQIRNGVKQSQLDLEAAIKDLEVSQNNVLFDVIGFFMNVVFNRELLETAKLQLESTEQQVERTERLVDAGSLPRADLLQLISQKATNELTVVQAENNLSLSLLQLKQLLLIPGTDAFEIDVPEIDIDEATGPAASVETVYDIAEQTMPEIQSADLKVESSELAVSISRGALYPTLSLSAGFFTNYSSAAAGDRTEFTGQDQTVTQQIGVVQTTGDPVVSQFTVPVTTSYDNNFGRQFNDNFSQSASLRLFIPVFQNFQSRSNYQRSVILNEQQKVLSRQARQQMRTVIETAYNDVIAASKTYTQSVLSVEALRETFRATDQRYNLGAANFTDWQIANNNLFRAQSDLLRAKYDYIFKQKVLDFYQGKPIEL